MKEQEIKAQFQFFVKNVILMPSMLEAFEGKQWWGPEEGRKCGQGSSGGGPWLARGPPKAGLSAST